MNKKEPNGLFVSVATFYKNLPTKAKFLLILLGFFIVSWIFELSNNWINQLSDAPVISQKNFESKYGDFKINIPVNKQNPDLLPYEDQDGIQGDEKLVLQHFIRVPKLASFEIAKVKREGSNLIDLKNWEIERVKGMANTIIESEKLKSTQKYEGMLLQYRSSTSGIFGTSFTCYDWVTYNPPEGYSIRFCSEIGDNSGIEKIFNEIIESFSIRDQEGR